MQTKNIAESILQYFLSCRLRQVLLYALYQR